VNFSADEIQLPQKSIAQQKVSLEAPIDNITSEQLMQFLVGLKKSCKENVVAESEKEHQNIDVQQSAHKFYEEYLAKYYPKALVIRSNFFTYKDPALVAGALSAFVDLLAKAPWFYVSNKPEGFKLTCYWEFIIDQCALINAYLKKAYINLEDNLVYVPNYSSYESSYSWRLVSKKKSERLLDHLKRLYNEILAAFYAFSFDYVVKLFNEGILLKDVTKVSRYFSDLEFIMEKIQNTRYESEYQEFMKIVKELVALFKQKRGADNAEMLDRLYGDDEKSKQYAQESIMLNSRY
jgi:hypothetical protein